MNAHTMTWLSTLRDEAQHPDTSMARCIEIFKTIAKHGLSR